MTQCLPLPRSGSIPLPSPASYFYKSSRDNLGWQGNLIFTLQTAFSLDERKLRARGEGFFG
jgi:hypothetical protein